MDGDPRVAAVSSERGLGLFELAGHLGQWFRREADAIWLEGFGDEERAWRDLTMRLS